MSISVSDHRKSYGVVYRADYDCDQFRRLSPITRCVYVALTLHATRQSREAWPKIESMARMVGTTPRSVQRALASLSEAGFIAITKRQQGPRRYNRYTLLDRDDG